MLKECLLSLPEDYLPRLMVNQADCYYISCCRGEEEEQLFAAVQIRHTGVFLHVGGTDGGIALPAALGNYFIASKNVFRFTAPLNEGLQDEIRAILYRSDSYQSPARNGGNNDFRR